MVQKVKEEEISFEGISEIIVAGDPGCTMFDDRAKRILGDIFSKRADAFIILGDMAHKGNAEELSDFISFCNLKSAAPVFTLCGNHDLPDYPAIFGRSTYTLLTGSLAVLFFDNVTSWDHFNRKDLEFIGRALNKYPDKRFIVLFHIPPPTDLAQKFMKDEKWGELKAVLDLYKDRIECLMCGHIHGFRDHIIDGYRVFITGGGGAKLYDLEKDIIKTHHAIKIKVDLLNRVGFEVIRV